MATQAQIRSVEAPPPKGKPLISHYLRLPTTPSQIPGMGSAAIRAMLQRLENLSLEEKGALAWYRLCSADKEEEDFMYLRDMKIERQFFFHYLLGETAEVNAPFYRH